MEESNKMEKLVVWEVMNKLSGMVSEHMMLEGDSNNANEWAGGKGWTPWRLAFYLVTFLLY